MTSSRYFKFVGNDLVNGAEAQAVPGWVRERIGQLHARLTDTRDVMAAAVNGQAPAAPYPCHFAANARQRGSLRYSYLEQSERASPAPLRDALLDYIAESPHINPFPALLVFVDTPPEVATMMDYEREFWSLLQRLHELDTEPWPEHMPLEPSHSDWEFCFGGEPLFIVGKGPPYQRRKSRWFDGLMILLQTQATLDPIDGVSPEAERIRRRIRSAVVAYDQMPLSPDLQHPETPPFLNWRQFWLRDSNDEPSLAQCPLTLRARPLPNGAGAHRGIASESAGDERRLYFTREELSLDFVTRRDADGRPACAEGFLSDEAWAEVVQTRRCPYAGSRRDHPMNLSALKQMTARWKEILGTLAYLNWSVATRGRKADHPASLLDVRRAAVAGVALPGYLFLRAARPLGDGELPGAVSAVNKVLYDVVEVIDSLCAAAARAGTLERVMREPAGVDAILDMAEQSGAFVGERGACAAPPHMLREAIEVLVHGDDERVATCRQECETLLDGGAPFLAYADAFFAMDAARTWLCARMAHVVSSLREQLDDGQRLAAAGSLLSGLRGAANIFSNLTFRRGREGRLEMIEVLGAFAQLEPTVKAASVAAERSTPAASELGVSAQLETPPTDPTLAACLGALSEGRVIERVAEAALDALADRVALALKWPRPTQGQQRSATVSLVGCDLRALLQPVLGATAVNAESQRGHLATSGRKVVP